MPCIDPRLGALACALLLAGCGQTPAPPPASSQPSAASTQPPGRLPGQAPGQSPGHAPPSSQRADVPLPPAPPARDWAHFKEIAARRLVAANPDRVYHGPVPDPLLAIPVLEVELSADGRILHVSVLRHPTQARDTTQIAIDAMYRAGPFGSVRHLPRPWKFAEVFLFDESRRFKPRSLDVD